MAEPTGAEAFMDTMVQETAASMDMSAAWNGGITDFPSWEVQDEVGKGTGYIGYNGTGRAASGAGPWEVELMVDSSSLTLRAKDLRHALLTLREWGGRFAEVDETIETLREERAAAQRALTEIRHVVAPVLADGDAAMGRVAQVREVINTWTKEG